jgi:hypothetical protein
VHVVFSIPELKLPVLSCNLKETDVSETLMVDERQLLDG